MAAAVELADVLEPDLREPVREERAGLTHRRPGRRVRADRGDREKPLEALALARSGEERGSRGEAPAHERPPSTERIWPEIQDARSEARNITASAMSSGRPSRRV